MSIEGALTITLQRTDKAIQSVQIASTRPLQAARVFQQKSPTEVISLIGLMYNICGIAQGRAAQLALSQALTRQQDSRLQHLNDTLVMIETVREHLCRITLDWPGFLNEQAHQSGLADLIRQLNEIKRKLQCYDVMTEVSVSTTDIEHELTEMIAKTIAVLQTTIIGQPLERWRELKDITSLSRWIDSTDTITTRLMQYLKATGWENLGANSVKSLPDLSATDLNKSLTKDNADQFIAQPTHGEHCYETTPLARQQNAPLIIDCLKAYGNGLLSRIVARVHELVTIVDRLRTAAASRFRSDSTANTNIANNVTLPSGVGIGQVEAARGHLIHRVELENELVKRYQILAPTEWNFHPEGVLAKALLSLTSHDHRTLQHQAALIINAIDPCVGYQLRIIEN